MVSFPFATLLGFGGSLLEFFTDKVRLLYISRRPKRIVPTISKELLIATYLVALALLSCLNPGGGSIYLIVGKFILL
jgi:hypothetical protein